MPPNSTLQSFPGLAAAVGVSRGAGLAGSGSAVGAGVGGIEYLQDLNCGPRPLVADIEVAAAWG